MSSACGAFRPQPAHVRRDFACEVAEEAARFTRVAADPDRSVPTPNGASDGAAITVCSRSAGTVLRLGDARRCLVIAVVRSRLDRNAGRNLLRRRDLRVRNVEVDLSFGVGDRRRRGTLCGSNVRGRPGLERLVARLRHGRADSFGVRRQFIGQRLELRLWLGDHGLEIRRFDLALSELLVSGNAAVARTGQRRVWAALAVRENRGAAAGELLVLSPAPEGSLGLGLGELAVGLDVDLPAGQTGGEAGIHALLADRERELVVGSDDRRLLTVVVEVDLANSRRRERLGDEARGLGIPGDDVDLLAAELGDDHANTRAARADAGADRIDALGVRLDGDLRAVAGLTRDAANLDQAIGDLGHLELEQRLDQLGIAPGDDHLRALGTGANLGDDGLDARALLVALAIDLLGARQERLDLAEVDEHVVAVARLLDNPGDDLGDAVDVLLVHHLALGLADPLGDDLLGGLRRDAAEVLRRHVRPLHLLLGDVGPVDLEVLVLDEHVRALAGLLLGLLELGQHALARLLEQPLLDVGRQLDRENAEVTLFAVELDHGMARRARRLLVGGEQRVLERLDQRVGLDALVSFELLDELDDLSAHLFPSSIRLPRTICSYGMSTGCGSVARWTACSSAPISSPLKRFRPAISAAVRSATRRPTKRSKCAGLRSGRSRPGEETSIVYSRR